MKPSKLLPVAIMGLLLASAWIMTFWLNADWYVKNIPNTFLLGGMVILALTVLIACMLIILSKLELKP